MLREKINETLVSAMKAGDSEKVGTLRMVAAAFQNREIEKKGKGLEPVLTDEEVAEVLMKEAKKRKESAEVYKQGGREDLVEKEIKELNIISEFLPEQATEEEIAKIVEAAIVSAGGQNIKDMGKVMAEAMKELKGKADGSAVSRIIKEKLGS